MKKYSCCNCEASIREGLENILCTKCLIKAYYKERSLSLGWFLVGFGVGQLVATLYIWLVS